MHFKVAVSYTDDCVDAASMLAKELHLTLVDIENEDYPLLLVKTPQHLELRFTANKKVKPFFVDFTNTLWTRRIHQHEKKPLIAKACGLKKNTTCDLLDLTAGWGIDGFTLMHFGANVTMTERNPIVFHLLQDAIVRYEKETIHKGKMILIQQEALSYLSSLEEDKLPDIIYLDPMYPDSTKSAKVKRPMQYMQALIGQDEDKGLLVEKALNLAQSRVVIKQPIHAHPFNELTPAQTFRGETVRYDVFLTQS